MTCKWWVGDEKKLNSQFADSINSLLKSVSALQELNGHRDGVFVLTAVTKEAF